MVYCICFFAYPVIYGEGKGWSDSMVGVIFIPIAGGVIIATAIAPFINRDYNKGPKSTGIEMNFLQPN